MLLNEQIGSLPGIGISILSEDLLGTNGNKKKNRTPLELSEIKTVVRKQSLRNMLTLYFQKMITFNSKSGMQKQTIYH